MYKKTPNKIKQTHPPPKQANKKKRKPSFRALCCRSWGGNVAGVNLISYFKHQSYRLSFSSVFRCVLKVTEIEACVWVNHRCLCIALGGFSVVILLFCFFTAKFCSVGSGHLVLQLARCLHCSGAWPLWSLLWSGEREGRQGTLKSLWGSSVLHNSGFALVGIQKSRRCEMSLKWIWTEQTADDMETKRLSINSWYSLPQVLLVAYLHITWILLLKLVGILLSEIEVWGDFSWKSCSIFFMLWKLLPLATALLDSDCVWVHLPVCVCVLLEILCYLLGHKYCVNHNGGLSTAGISPSVEVHKTEKVLRKSSPHLESPSWWSLGSGSCLEWMIWNNFVYSLTP